MEAMASSHYHSAWQAEGKLIQMGRKTSQVCLCFDASSLSIEEHLQKNSNKSYLSEPRESLEMKHVIRVAWCF